MKKMILGAVLTVVGVAAMAQSSTPPDRMDKCPPPKCERSEARFCDKCGQQLPKFKDAIRGKKGAHEEMNKPFRMHQKMTDEQKKEFEKNRQEMKTLVDACRADRSESNVAKLKAAIKANMEKMQSRQPEKIAKIEKKLAKIEKELGEETDADDIAELKSEKAKLQGWLERMKAPPAEGSVDQKVEKITNDLIDGKFSGREPLRHSKPKKD